MDFLFILIAIIWVVITAANNKKKTEQAKAETQRKQEEALHRMPQGKPVEKPFDPYAPEPEKAPATAAATYAKPAAAAATAVPRDAQKKAAPVAQSAPASRHDAPPQSRLREAVQTQLRQSPAQHPLEASSLSGHAHMESSITGIQPDCGSVKSMGAGQSGAEKPAAAAAVQAGSTPPSGNAGFCWNQNAVLQGIVMAEILGKPKSLRQDGR